LLLSPEPHPAARSKKAKKSHQPPSGIQSSWKKNQKSGQITQQEKTPSEGESAVRYRGLVGDSEDDSVETSAIAKKSYLAKGNRQSMVSIMIFNERLDLMSVHRYQ
jgi:hypothetical protein